MGEFLDVVIGFPTAIFTFLLVVVVAYWLLVLFGGLGVDALDADQDAGDGGDGGFLNTIGLGGVPVTVAISVLIALGWFLSLAGSVLAGEATLALVGVLVVATAGGWLGTRLVLLPLRRLFPDTPGPSRADFVGRPCVIRTGRVGTDFGQAEVTALDGSSAIVQVRQTGPDTLRAGSPAVIYDYDATGEFFWVVPVDAGFGTPTE